MKKIIYTISIMVFAALFILTGCPGDLNIGHPKADEGKGFVTLGFGVETDAGSEKGAGSLSRTVLPSTPSFGGYEIKFIPVNEGEPDYDSAKTYPKEASLHASYEIEIGTYILEVKTYAKMSDTSIAASGISDEFTVTQNETVNATVTLIFNPVSMTGNGNFQWVITNNNSGLPAVDQTQIFLKSLGTQADWTSPLNAASNTNGVSIPAGYYLATVRQERNLITPFGSGTTSSGTAYGAIRSVFDDIVHIYPDQVTRLTHTFGANEFFHDIKNVWLRCNNVDAWNLAEAKKNPDGTFSWRVEKPETPSSVYFRFALTDRSQPGGAWFSPVPASQYDINPVAVTLGNSYQMNFIDFRTYAELGAGIMWYIPASVTAGLLEITLNPVTRQVTVTKPVVVDEIKVEGDNDIIQGRSKNYTAQLVGANLPANPVFAWSIETADTADGTAIEQSGRLTVAENEANDTIIIKASYGDVSKTKEITVVPINITGVQITGAASIIQGSSANYSAVLQGDPLPLGAHAFKWEIVTTGITQGTEINQTTGALKIALTETNTSIVIKAVFEKNNLKAGEKIITITAADPGNVVIEGSSQIQAGQDLPYTAKLVDGNYPLENPDFSWSIETANTKPGTSIDANGLLTVAGDEDNTPLTIKATLKSAIFTKSETKVIEIVSVAVMPLSPVTNVVWSDSLGTASWDSPAENNGRLSGFTVKLFKNNGDLAVSTQTLGPELTSFDFLAIMRSNGAGAYTFSVVAVGIPGIENSEEVKSAARNITPRNAVAAVTWQSSKDTVQWNNAYAALGSGLNDYLIQVYTRTGGVDTKVGEDKNIIQTGGANAQSTYNLAANGFPKNLNDTQYVVKVTTLSNPNSLIVDSDAKESTVDNYSLFGNSRVYTIIKGKGAGQNYVAGAESGKIAWSTDGIIWTLSTKTDFGTNAVRAIAHNNGTGSGVFIAVGGGGKITRSTDGGKEWTAISNWSNSASTIPGSYLTITYGGTGNNARFVAAGEAGHIRASTNSAGDTWRNMNTLWDGSYNQILQNTWLEGTANEWQPPMGWRDINFLVHDGAYFMAFNNNPGKHAKSTTGIDWDWVGNVLDNWTIREISFGAYGNNIYMFVNPEGAISSAISSGNGLYSWKNNYISPMAYGTLSISFSGNQFLLTGTQGRARSSSDGNTWIPITNSFGSAADIHAAYRMDDNRVILAGAGKMEVTTAQP